MLRHTSSWIPGAWHDPNPHISDVPHISWLNFGWFHGNRSSDQVIMKADLTLNKSCRTSEGTTTVFLWRILDIRVWCFRQNKKNTKKTHIVTVTQYPFPSSQHPKATRITNNVPCFFPPQKKTKVSSCTRFCDKRIQENHSSPGLSGSSPLRLK